MRSFIIAVAGLAFAFKIALALNTYGTNDVIFWEANWAKIRADGGLALYRDGAQIFQNGCMIRTELFNQPPFIIHTLRFWASAAEISGLPLRFWLRLTSSLADLGSLILIWKILMTSRLHLSLLPLLSVAISPVSIMVSGFHGNTDPVMIFLLLLSIYLLESRSPTWLVGAAFGMAMNIKIVPIIFAPVFLLYLPTTRRRIELMLAAATIFAAGSMPYLSQDPQLVTRMVFGYSGVPGNWGISRVVYVLLPEGAYEAYRSAAKLVALAIILTASFLMNWRGHKPALFVQCGCVAFLFLFWSSGFGVQYLAWLVPWGAAISVRGMLFYYASSGVFLFQFYTLWSKGFPWFLANALDKNLPVSPLFVLSLETVCWTSVGFVAFACCRRTWLTKNPATQESLRA